MHYIRAGPGLPEAPQDSSQDEWSYEYRLHILFKSVFLIFIKFKVEFSQIF